MRDADDADALDDTCRDDARLTGSNFSLFDRSEFSSEFSPSVELSQAGFGRDSQQLSQ